MCNSECPRCWLKEDQLLCKPCVKIPLTDPLKCKRGHIKCDEAKPKCSRCIKSNLNCEYKKPDKKSKGCRSERISQRIILPKAATEELSKLIIRPLETNSGFDDEFAVEKAPAWMFGYLEGRMRPGERMIPRQASPLTQVLKPSDCLAIDMPLKSKELFHYCKTFLVSNGPDVLTIYLQSMWQINNREFRTRINEETGSS